MYRALIQNGRATCKRMRVLAFYILHLVFEIYRRTEPSPTLRTTSIQDCAWTIRTYDTKTCLHLKGSSSIHQAVIETGTLRRPPFCLTLIGSRSGAPVFGRTIHTDDIIGGCRFSKIVNFELGSCKYPLQHASMHDL